MKFVTKLARNGWRIAAVEGDYEINLCGAASEVVAWDQCQLLNKIEARLTAAAPTVKVVMSIAPAGGHEVNTTTKG